MIASLPMYATPRIEGATDRLWSGIRDALRQAGISAPECLSREIPDLHSHWLDPELVLSQTCGMPFRTVLRGRVTLIGTPDYGVEGCPPGYYRSVVVARSRDARRSLAEFAGARFAYNEPGSQSGWAALANERPDILDGPRLRTGAHVRSAEAVAQGRADFASIDAVTWRLLCAEGGVGELTVIHETPPTPGLPLIAAAGADASAVFAAVERAIHALPRSDRELLGLRGLCSMGETAYLSVPTPAGP